MSKTPSCEHRPGTILVCFVSECVICGEEVVNYEGNINWLPSSDNINALPDPIRKYIHDLETRCDPSGDVQERALMRDNMRGLEGLVLELRAAKGEE